MQLSNLSAVLQKIATGPHLSKDLTEQEAYEAMSAIQSGDVSDVQSGIFFIALRMKRESANEMIGVFRSILDAAPSHVLNVPELVTFSDQYAGYSRGLPASAFVPAVLSALGIASVAHSPKTMSPKYGLTVLSVLEACGVRASESLASAANILEHDSGWVVIDQSVITPKLAALNDLRGLIVKRPCLSTLECCVRPFHATAANHLVTGYVHKPYPPIYAMCADVAGFDSATFVRGVEGGIVPSVAQVSRYFPWHRDEHASALAATPAQVHLQSKDQQQSISVIPFDEIGLSEVQIDPAALGIEQAARTVPWPDVEVSNHTVAARECAALGMAALQGEVGLMRDGVRLGAAVAVAGLRRKSLNSALKSVDAVLESGKAWRCFDEKRTL